MKKKFLGFIVLLFTMTGCGSDSEVSITSSNTNTSFVLDGESYALFLPKEWSVSAQPNTSGKLFLAHKYSTNIVFVPGGIEKEDTLKQLIEDAKNHLPEFKLVSEESDEIVFETSSENEKRTHKQRIISFDPLFVLGSCSWKDPALEEECTNILDSLLKE